MAGTTLGFAKDNVKKIEVETTTTKEVKETAKTPQINSLEESEAFKATCTDVYAFFDEVEHPNGDIDYVYDGLMEITYECDNAELSLYLWIY